jgi:hypothetical protein
MTIANDVQSYNEALGGNSNNWASGGAIHNKRGADRSDLNAARGDNLAVGGMELGRS